MEDLEGVSIDTGDSVIIQTNDGMKRGTVIEVNPKVAIVETKDHQLRTVVSDRIIRHERI